MLDERKAAILRAVVEEYIDTAQPVGSAHVVKSSGVQVSSATVRNDMATLEQEGYLRQPHTSAGRIPTEKGYRFFVDNLGAPVTLKGADAVQVRSFFDHAHGEIEQMLQDTSRLLGDLTSYAGVVVGASPAEATVRSVQVVGLTATSAVVVAVLSNGAVEKHSIDLTQGGKALQGGAGEERIAAASAHLAAHLVGAARSGPMPMPKTGDVITDALCALAAKALATDQGEDPEQVFVGGTSRIANAFDAIETVREVLGILEQQYVVVTLLRDVIDRGLQVAIGTETGMAPLADCALIVSPYQVEGEPAGSIGVLGPARMDYPQALAAVAVVSNRLSQRLSEGVAVADYYDLLEASRDASVDEIKRAYRRLARQLHPDTNPDPGASDRFKAIAQAYEVLSDPEKRQRYDRFGPDGVNAGAGSFAGGGINDIFEAFFGGASPFGGGGTRRPSGPPRGSDLEVTVDLAFEDAVFGIRQPVEVRTAVGCESCDATGAAPGTQPVTCLECAGTGQVQRVRQSFLGQMVTNSVCPRCGGQGQVISDPCPACRGEGRTVEERTYTVDVPAGVDTGSTLRLTGRGAAGPRGGASGDLYVHIRVRPHDRFTRDGFDLRCDLPISFSQAALGAHIEFDTLDGPEDLVIPRGTPSGREFRLRGRGVPHLERRSRGDLIVRARVQVPDDLSPEQEDLLRQFAEQRGEDVAPADAGFLSRIRSAFR